MVGRRFQRYPAAKPQYVTVERCVMAFQIASFPYHIFSQERDPLRLQTPSEKGG